MSKSSIGKLEGTMVQALGQEISDSTQIDLSIIQQFPEHHRAHDGGRFAMPKVFTGKPKHAERALASPSDLEATLLLADASLGKSKEAIELNRKVLHQQPNNKQAMVSWLP